MIDIELAGKFLDDMAEEIPQELLKGLNGGILLFPESKRHADPDVPELYILGEYHNTKDLGRYIIIYFGSFELLYPNISESKLRKRLREVLLHELTHHIESLAGDRTLEIQDSTDIMEFKRKKFGSADQ